MIRFGIIQFSSVNNTEASVFGYSVFTRFDRPLRQCYYFQKALVYICPFNEDFSAATMMPRGSFEALMTIILNINTMDHDFTQQRDHFFLLCQ